MNLDDFDRIIVYAKHPMPKYFAGLSGMVTLPDGQEVPVEKIQVYEEVSRITFERILYLGDGITPAFKFGFPIVQVQHVHKEYTEDMLSHIRLWLVQGRIRITEATETTTTMEILKCGSLDSDTGSE